MKGRWVFLLMLFMCVSAAVGVFPRSGLTQNQTSRKVVLAFDVGGRGDGGFNDAAFKGMERAVAELGVKVVYVENRRNLEREVALNEAAASDAGMIIGVGFAFSDKLNRLAVRYPEKKFVCIDYSANHDDKGRVAPLPANLSGVQFREQEASYLVGAMAALKSKTGKIGFIGGMDSPLIRRFQAGYQAGAIAVRPEIKVLSRFAGITGQAFHDPQRGFEIATAMYRQGADIIYHAAGATGAGLFRAAGQMKRLVIGVDVDQWSAVPGLVLTSMTKNIDVAVFESVKSGLDGTFTGGLKSIGLKEKGVGFVYNDRNRGMIPRDVMDRVLALQAKIVAGQLVPPASIEHKAVISIGEIQNLLARLQKEIAEALFGLDADIARCARSVSGVDLKGATARSQLQRLYRENSYIIDCETVSDRGIMLSVEPAEHRGSEGADISAQEHIIRLFKTGKPVMSGSFRSVEGPDAVVVHHPVFSGDHRFSGSVSALFAPEYLLSGIIGPVASALPVDIFLMQTDGLMIYDLDPGQIGRNVFTDPLYQPFTELLALARKVAAADEGTGVYRFFRDGATEPVRKEAYWNTVGLHGSKWRLVITCASDHIEK